MIAQTLAISVPNEGCEKNCPYCVSKMTGYMSSHISMMFRNLDKVKQLAKTAQVSSVIITSKGEPLFNEESVEMVKDLGSYFKKYPLEIQTNGVALLKEPSKMLQALKNSYYNIVAISIDQIPDILKYKEIIALKESVGLIFRATINLTEMLGIVKQPNFKELINLLKETGFKQVSFREITIPTFGIVDTVQARETVEWIEKYSKGNYSNQLKRELDEVIKKEARMIRKLSYGATLYDFEDIAITYFDYCIQDNSGEDDIRSLIFQEDGHLYTTWNSKASLIF